MFIINMRDNMTCASCDRKIKDDDACVFLERKMEQIMSLTVMYVPKYFKS